MRAQGSGGKLSVDKTVVNAGEDITVTGPPGEVVIVKTDGTSGGAKTVTLDSAGKAKVPTGNQSCRMTLGLLSEPNKPVIVQVVDLR